MRNKKSGLLLLVVASLASTSVFASSNQHNANCKEFCHRYKGLRGFAYTFLNLRGGSIEYLNTTTVSLSNTVVAAGAAGQAREAACVNGNVALDQDWNKVQPHLRQLGLSDTDETSCPALQ